jgi:lysine decarboxylase
MKMPIYQMLRTYSKGNFIPFHMPGHILGKGLAEEFKILGRFDITEIPGSDCLHYPQGVIKEAQELATYCFGAGCTLFLVNGSTSGIHAMILSTVKPGGKLILARDCHVSVLNILAAINAEPVFIQSEMDWENRIPLGVKASHIEEAIKKNSDVQGILITRPSYYGTASELADIVKISRKYNIPLMIDEAHGAHFAFSRRLPETAMNLGADISVQSLHKTLPALTQTAVLHINKNSLVNKEIIKTAVSMVQTTSPSYILMTSIDIARQIMEYQGEELYERLYEIVYKFDLKLSNCRAIKRVGLYNNCESDFSRINISFKNTELTGFQAEALLREKYGIVAEMADLYNVVFIATPFHTGEDFDRLFNALYELSVEYGKEADFKNSLTFWPDTIPERAVPLREAMFGNRREVDLARAAGCLCAQPLIPWPPGIPVLNPGEIITHELIEFIQCHLNQGGTINGVNNSKVWVLKKD